MIRYNNKKFILFNYSICNIQKINIKSNFFKLRCLTPQQKKSLRDIIGSNLTEIQSAGSHSRRKRFASKKSRKSHRHRPRRRHSTHNKKRNTKRHINRHTKRYRHRK